MIIKANETLKDSNLAVNSNNINYPASNILDSRLTSIYKTVTGITTAEIVFDAGSAVTVDSINIANHNISSGVTTLKWQGNATNVWTSPSVDETLTYYSGIINKQFTGGTYRYWRLQVIDTSNTDGFISIGRVYGSEQSNPPPIAPLFSYSKESASKKSIGIAGQSYGDKRYLFDMISIKWPKVSHAEKALIITWFEIIDITDPFFVTFNEDCLDMLTYYVTLDVKQISFNLLRNRADYEASISFREAF